MSLSCECDFDHDFEAGDWSYFTGFGDYVSDFEKLATSKRKRCCSCNELINIGSLCFRHPRYRYPYNDIEARIRGMFGLEDSLNNEPCIKIADHYHCERCGEIFLNLESLGYCIFPTSNMEDSLKDYHELTGFEFKTKEII